MNYYRVLPALVAGTIILLTIATSSFGVIGIQEAPSEFENAGSGNATIELTSSPETVTIRTGTEGQSIYYLDVPPSTVSITSIRGNPLLNYELRIEELSYSVSSVTPLHSIGSGTHQIGMERQSFNSNQITQDTYQGQLKLVLRGEEGEFVIFDRDIMVEVDE